LAIGAVAIELDWRRHAGVGSNIIAFGRSLLVFSMQGEAWRLFEINSAKPYHPVINFPGESACS
jgi:hypothetical protein